MASTDSRPLPLKNTAFRLYFTAYDSSGVPVTGFTSPDSELSKDGGAYADATNEATYVGHGQGYIDLTSGEMNYDHVGFYFSCSEGSTRDCISICPAQNGSLPVNVVQCGGSTVAAGAIPNAVAGASGGLPLSADASGRVDVIKINGTSQTARNIGADTAAIVADTDALEGRLTSTRAGYLDNLSGGLTATQADVNNLNQSASRRMLLTTLQQYERPESGSTTFQIEARTYTADGALVNADTPPTLTATGLVSGDLAANLDYDGNPSTGVYRWSYEVTNLATPEQIRFDLSAVIDGDTQTLVFFSSVCDFVAATFTTTDRTNIETMKADTADIKARTDNLPIDPADASDIASSFGSLTSLVGGVADDVGTVNTKLGTPAGASVSADIAAVKAETALIVDDTGNTGVALSTSALTALADAVTDEPLAGHTTDGTVGKSLANVYAAQIDLTDDNDNGRDEYTVQWFNNGNPVTSGITSPTIQVVKRLDGTDLVAVTTMTQIGSTGAYKYDESTNRISDGEAVLVQCQATIDGAARTWRKVVSRDSIV